MTHPKVTYPPYPFDKSTPFVQVTDMPKEDTIRLWLQSNLYPVSEDVTARDLTLCRVNLREATEYAEIENWLYVSEKLFNELRSIETSVGKLLRPTHTCANHIVGLNSKYRQYEELPYLIRADDVKKDFIKYFNLAHVKFNFCPECGQDVSKFFDNIRKQLELEQR